MAGNCLSKVSYREMETLVLTSRTNTQLQTPKHPLGSSSQSRLFRLQIKNKQERKTLSREGREGLCASEDVGLTC